MLLISPPLSNVERQRVDGERQAFLEKQGRDGVSSGQWLSDRGSSAHAVLIPQPYPPLMSDTGLALMIKEPEEETSCLSWRGRGSKH